MVVYWDRGLFVAQARLALDVTRRQPLGFISHAHADHMAPHELALCTPATALLYRHRRGAQRAVREMPFGHSIALGACQLTTYPAGHIWGSAMLLVEEDQHRLLYTGDFKLSPSATAEPAQLPPADTLVVESTYGDPRFRLPPRDEVLGEFLAAVRCALNSEQTPVIHAYVLGKAQEVTRILTSAGIPVLQHPEIFAISQLYEQAGCELGTFDRYAGIPLPGHAVVVPPRSQRSSPLPGITRPYRMAMTGWALRDGCRRWLGVDAAFPVSDHADFSELLQAIDQVQARRVICTHGPASFVDVLQARGIQAECLNRAPSGPIAPC